MSSCLLLRSLAKWSRLCLFSLCLVGTASLLWNRWPGSLRTFSVWVRTSCVLQSSGISRSALFSISSMGVVFMAPTMARSVTLDCVQHALVGIWSSGPGGCGILHDQTGTRYTVIQTSGTSPLFQLQLKISRSVFLAIGPNIRPSNPGIDLTSSGGEASCSQGKVSNLGLAHTRQTPD